MRCSRTASYDMNLYSTQKAYDVTYRSLSPIARPLVTATVDNSDHIYTEGGHAEHVLVTRISNKMDDSSTDKQIFEFSKCPSPVEFRAAIYIVKCFRLKGIAEHVDHSTASL